MKHIILTGEKIDRIVIESFYKYYDHIPLINAYGQSECSDDTFHYIIPQKFALADIPIGKPIQNVSYYGTGDIVKLNENQDVICLGRADNQIKIRGYRIEPEEIETHLNQIEGINKSIVIALETNEIDKILGAYYTGEDNVNAKDIASYLSSKLPAYMIPSVFKRVEKFVLNANGKIDRNRILECVEIIADDSATDYSDIAGLSDIQKRAFEVINSNLDSKNINVTLETAFAGTGVDSITFITLVVALEGEFGFEFDDEKLLITEFPTIKSMIEYVELKVQ